MTVRGWLAVGGVAVAVAFMWGGVLLWAVMPL